MTDRFPGFSWEPTPLRAAAAVLLVREGAAGCEIFWVRRARETAAWGGFSAFPGGKVDPADHELPLAGGPFEDSPLRAAAIRELFEEAGVLLVRGAAPLPPARLDALRRELLAGASFRAILEREGLFADGSRLSPAGRWVTPDFSPVRFDARFYLVGVPSGAPASVIRGELAEGGWILPAEALRQWEAGTVLLHPPTHHALAVLAGWSTESALPHLRSPRLQADGFIGTRIEFQRGIHFVPLRTPTIPPAAHTNCVVVGTGELAIVDPGSPDAAEQARLERLLDAFVSEGRTPRAVLLTHHHPDHTGGALRIAARYGIPVLAGIGTKAHIPDRELAEAVREIPDGESIDLAGPMPMKLRALRTEGHCEGHLAFVVEPTGAILAGDLVATGSTIVIDPPEGRLDHYLASLARLRELPPGALYPAHGMVVPDGPAKLAEVIEHREMRIVQVADALARGIDTPERIVAEVYTGTPAWLAPLAARSVLASIEELERRKRAARA